MCIKEEKHRKPCRDRLSPVTAGSRTSALLVQNAIPCPATRARTEDEEEIDKVDELTKAQTKASQILVLGWIDCTLYCVYMETNYEVREAWYTGEIDGVTINN